MPSLTCHTLALLRRITLLCLLLPAAAQAWNANGHRLTAVIAWQQLSPSSREQLANLLAEHPDYARWQQKSRSTTPQLIFAEASTWPDEIRHDPRFYREDREAPTPPIPGLPDTAQHRPWHYVDLDADGRVASGELDQQLGKLVRRLQRGGKASDVAWTLPWIIHLVADLHQPLHVGRADDAGGNGIEIENPFDSRQPFTNLHSYWDSLPGTTSLRGERLLLQAERLLADFPPPSHGTIIQWRHESHRLLSKVYPDHLGSLLPSISEPYHRQAGQLARRRLVDAGYRLGWLLEASLKAQVSRETKD